jgi:hypothetical protein
MVDYCSCRVESGELIDLHWARNSEDGKPVFRVTSGERLQSIEYTYTPCAGFPCNNLATNSSVCVQPSVATQGINLGNLTTVKFEVEKGNLTLLYTANGQENYFVMLIVIFTLIVQ